MKKKRSIRALALKRQSLRQLTQSALETAKGGGQIPRISGRATRQGLIRDAPPSRSIAVTSVRCD